MLTQLTQVIREPNRFLLKEIFVNYDHVITITEDTHLEKQNSSTGPIVEGLNRQHRFSRININSGGQSRSITVIGAPEVIMKEFKKNKRQVLRG
jgi:hypothetical protein